MCNIYNLCFPQNKDIIRRNENIKDKFHVNKKKLMNNSTN